MRENSLIAAIVLLCFSGSARAGENPGSLMVFPVFNSQDGYVTMLTVTNTNPTQSILVRYTYVDGADCSSAEYDELLSPNDTFTCLTAAHNPGQPTAKGYVQVHARTVSGQEPVAFNYLVGTSMVVDGVEAGNYALNPFMFRGMHRGAGGADVNGNGRLDLDGVEYSKAPARIVIPRFLGQEPTDITSSLILIDATSGAGWDTSVAFTVFNDNESIFSVDFAFQCWEEVKLLDVSQLFSNDFLKNFTNHDPQEIFGAPIIESGWFFIEGSIAQKEGFPDTLDPAILAVLVEPSIGQQSAAAPFQVGHLDNGSFGAP